MLLTWIHRTCLVLHTSTDIHPFQSLEQYLPTSKPYFQLPKPSQGNALAFLSLDCRTQRMMVVDYNGILFQDVGSVAQSGWNLHKTSITYKSLGHFHKAPALGYRRDSQVYKKMGEPLINDNYQTFWPLYKVL